MFSVGLERNILLFSQIYVFPHIAEMKYYCVSFSRLMHFLYYFIHISCVVCIFLSFMIKFFLIKNMFLGTGVGEVTKMQVKMLVPIMKFLGLLSGSENLTPAPC